jgi:hypothetical protein
VRLGVLPKRDARRRAAWLGTLAQSAFEHWRRGVEGLEYGEFPHSDVGFPKGDSPAEFLANMMTFLKEAAARLENPAPPPVFSPAAMRELAAIQESVVIEQEIRKGDAGHPTVTSRADLLRQDVWDRWRAGQGIAPIHAPLTDAIGKLAEVADRQLAILERTNSDSTIQPKQSLRPMDRPIPSASSDPLQTAAAATIETSTAPLFSQLENDYVNIRKNGGASDATISTIRLRVNAFKVLVGDRPIDCYAPIDLQNYVNTIQYLPLEMSREGKDTAKLKAMGLHAAIEKNRVERCWETLGIATIRDGYVQNIRAIINNAVGLRRLNDPFQGYRIRWPDDAKPPVKRETLDYEKLNKVFELGVASEYLDDAMLGPLCLLSTRRIGILPWIRGCDIDVKHGVDIVRVNGIVFDKKQQKYVRIGYKTEDSLRFFVLHNKFRQCGFVDWAKQQGDQFLFRLLQSCSDPSDAASKRINALLKRAGARGMNIEVGHSIRHGGKDVLMEEEIDSDATRLQMGHPLNDVHSSYGKRAELNRKQCQELAHFDLPAGIDWSMFDGLDFEAMASRPRVIGRPRRV